jgi:diaminopimelate decarboxylase
MSLAGADPLQAGGNIPWNVLPATASATPDGHLSVGGCDVVELAREFGTPLIVIDRETFEARANAFAGALGADSVFYAGKALLCLAVCRLVDSLGLSLDVCSEGELVTALRAGFPPDRILYHGNNKTDAELRLAKEAGVGRIVADSFDELDRLEQIGVASRILLRITPGVRATTHRSIQTGHEDSKFGFVLAGDEAFNAVRRVLELPDCEFAGLHAHIGSQISEREAFEEMVSSLAELIARLDRELGVRPEELNVGGGFAITQTRTQSSRDPAAWTEILIEAAEREFEERGLPVPKMFVEPGRSIIGPAGVTLYTAGTVKRRAAGRNFVAVDGGMSDNPRPALYGARYEVVAAGRLNDTAGWSASLAGMHCEQGDVLIEDCRLPETVEPGDILAVAATGAYSYSMASNYNRVPRPAVVLIDHGRPEEIVTRESPEDVVRLDVDYIPR